MNKAVAGIVGASAVNSLPLGFAPGRSGTDFVDPAHVIRKSCFVVESNGISRDLPDFGRTVSAAPAYFKGVTPDAPPRLRKAAV
jgi:hypothetical protein